jgi:cobalt-zinc-cadmium efflux system membrane fusion protein
MFSIGLLALAGFLVSGCDSSTDSPSVDNDVSAESEAGHGHNHGGWWCTEHGVPEEVCTRCQPKLAVAFQEEGDWCEEHGLPDSQCFVHHPELEAKFAAQYKAKMGEEPPKPTE